MALIHERKPKEMVTFILKSTQVATVFKSLDGCNGEEEGACSEGALQMRTMKEGPMEVDGSQLRKSQEPSRHRTGWPVRW